MSKAYGLIDRFSEDVDLTYDIRRFLPGMNFDEDGIPPTKSQESN
ncbi:nucleotidyl transferase AbiEii/AbiGii toxin family protein [Rhizobium beringeri]